MSPTAHSAAPATSRGGALHSTVVLARDIKLSHSVFAMPFAMLGLFMAARPPAPSPSLDGRTLVIDLALVIVAMVTARTTAMLANRWFDRDIDRRNPRTASRAIPAGHASPTVAFAAMVASALGFVIVCSLFLIIQSNPWPLLLSGPVLIWLAGYPLMKRLTWTCHLWLGLSLAMSPLAAAIAVQPDAVAQQVSLWLLAGMVLCWVAGFDVIYALQDIEIDRVEGLHSIPARFGYDGALWISRLLHLLAVALLVLAYVFDGRLGMAFLLATAVAASLLLVEHLTVRRWGTTRMALTFLTLNGVVSCVLGAAGILDLFLASS
jgi:4-hydroxybenzoate polyprenyltransferase